MTERLEITVYGADWCPDCIRCLVFFNDHLVSYTWIDIEADQKAADFVLQVNAGKRIIPTIIFSDGSILVEPSPAELAGKLGL